MAYNLIDQAWIPVRRESGRVERIAPWQIAEATDPAIAIESSRPDFDAALLEFLIGLVQTVFTPADEDDWVDAYAGIAPDALRARMNAVRDAFFLDGDGPRFMQDLDVHRDPKVMRAPVVGLLIDQGTASASDLFAKSGRYEALSYPAVAAALLTLQNFAPSGGRGQCTSLRGGGPLSVTIDDKTLWRSVWCNVLSKSALAEVPGNGTLMQPESRFPWMARTRTSESKTGANTLPEHLHPLQHFWGLPRRVRVDFSGGVLGDCAIAGDQGVPVVTHLFSRPDGTSYDGPFLHPLTPYTAGKDGEAPNPKKGRTGVAYRDWPLLVTGGDKLIPPRVVTTFLREERWRVAGSRGITARGYAMDNMKPVRFIDARAPLLHSERRILQRLQSDVGGLVAASESVRRSLSQQVKAAWSDRPADQPGDVGARVDTAFWSGTESAFYRAVDQLNASLSADDDAGRLAARQSFLVELHDGVMRIFDEICPLDVELGPDGLARLVGARRDLVRFTDPSSPSLLKLVGLAGDVGEKEAAKPRKTAKPRGAQKEQS